MKCTVVLSLRATKKKKVIVPLKDYGSWIFWSFICIFLLYFKTKARLLFSINTYFSEITVASMSPEYLVQTAKTSAFTWIITAANDVLIKCL